MRESSGPLLWKEESLWKEETLLKVESLTKPSPEKLSLLRIQQRQDGRVKSDINTQGLVDSQDAVEGANKDTPLWGTQSREKPSSQNPRPCKCNRRERQGVTGNPDFYMQGLVDHEEGVEGAREDPPLWRIPSSEKLSPQNLTSFNRNERQGERGNPNVYMQGLLDNEDGMEGAGEDPPFWRTPSTEKPSPPNLRPSSRQERWGGRGKRGVYMQGLVDTKDGVKGASKDPPLWRTPSRERQSPPNPRSFSRQETGVYTQGLGDTNYGVEEASVYPPLWRTPSREKLSPQNPRSSCRQGRRGRRGKPDVYTQGLLDNKDGVEGASQDPPLWRPESIQKPSPQNQRLFSRQETHSERGKSDVYLQAAAAAKQEAAQNVLEAEIAAKIAAAKQEAMRRVQEAENAAIIASAKREAMRKAQEAENASKEAIKVATNSRSTAQLLMANAELMVYKSVISLRIAEAKRLKRTFDLTSITV